MAMVTVCINLCIHSKLCRAFISSHEEGGTTISIQKHTERDKRDKIKQKERGRGGREGGKKEEREQTMLIVGVQLRFLMTIRQYTPTQHKIQDRLSWDNHSCLHTYSVSQEVHSVYHKFGHLTTTDNEHKNKAC